MTPCQEMGYKVGDKFKVLEDRYGFTKGQLIELYKDDGSYAPLFRGHNSDFNWCDGLEGAFLNIKHVALVKEEKERMFSKKDLKTGYIMEVSQLNRVQLVMVFLGTANGDIVAGETWFPLDSYTDEELVTGSKGVKVHKVYRLKTNADHSYAIINGLKRQLSFCTVVWERKEETEQDKKLKELEDTIRTAQQQIEEIRKQKA